MILVVV